MGSMLNAREKLTNKKPSTSLKIRYWKSCVHENILRIKVRIGSFPSQHNIRTMPSSESLKGPWRPVPFVGLISSSCMSFSDHNHMIIRWDVKGCYSVCGFSLVTWPIIHDDFQHPIFDFIQSNISKCFQTLFWKLCPLIRF